MAAYLCYSFFLTAFVSYWILFYSFYFYVTIFFIASIALSSAICEVICDMNAYININYIWSDKLPFIYFVLFYCYSFFFPKVYPVVVHSIWSSDGFLTAFTDEPFRGVGMIDFAGSGVVHMTGGAT
jgi:ammonia channel protein AmtB